MHISEILSNCFYINVLTNMNMLQTTTKLALIAFAAAPMVCVAAPAAADSAAVKTRAALVEKLANAGALKAENKSALMALPVEEVAGVKDIQVTWNGSAPVITLAPNHLESLCKKMTQAEAFQTLVGEMGAALARAELMLELGGDTDAIPQDLQQGLADAMAVSAINVITGKKQKAETHYSSAAVKQYMTQGAGAACLQYDQAKGVYVPVYSALPSSAPQQAVAATSEHVQPGVLNILSGGMGGKPVATKRRTVSRGSAKKAQASADKKEADAAAPAPAAAAEEATPFYLNPLVLGGAGGGLLLLIIIIAVAKKKK